MASKPTIADPLIAALIAKLPPSGASFPPDQQKAWLKLMALALSATYGGDVSADLDAPAKPAAPAPKPHPATTQYGGFPFVIDGEGYARRGKDGKRILPSQVTDVLYDLRGEAGDMRTVIWADGSTGIAGDLIVSPALQ